MDKLLTQTVLQTIIICCTIAILGIIGVSLYRIHKNQRQSFGSYIFRASVVSILAIGVFSYTFCWNRNVLDFISLASALISIILAVITIIYSFYTNSRSTSQIETLNNAAKSVEKATLSYSESAESLQENIQKIIKAVSRVEEKTDKLLESKLSTSDTSGRDYFTSFDLDSYVSGYVNLSSPMGIMAIYACILAKDKNKEWSLNLFSSDQNKAYCGGFLISTTCTGLLISSVDFNSWNVKVNNYLPIVKEKIFNWIDSNNISKYGEWLLDLKNSIDKYFEE